jgi:diguanylate cyclase (GGDEF)-like protein/PAS domain S-box-containing protein
MEVSNLNRHMLAGIPLIAVALAGIVCLVAGPEPALASALLAGLAGSLTAFLAGSIRDRDALLRSVIDAAPEAFVSIDERGRIVEWSAQAERCFGWLRADAIGRKLVSTIIPPQDRRQCEPLLCGRLQRDSRILDRRLEISAMRRDGTRFPAEVSFSALRTRRGMRFNAFLHDISDRRRSEQALSEANERFRTAFDQAAIGMAIVGTDGRWMRINRALVELTGYPQERLVGMGFPEITHPEDLPKDYRALQEMVEGLRDRFQTEKRYIHADGHLIWVSISTTVVRDGEGRPLYLLSQMQDISERKETERRLAHRATHDELTGLPNRGVLEDRMALAIARQRRERRPIAILYLDLDGFKAVNDTHGHDAGDYLLIAIAKRLSALLRPTDLVTRLGGDEFAILCEDADEHGATRLAKRIVEVVPRPIEVEGHEVSVTPSIGIALSRDPLVKPGSLLADADMAMYFAKEQGSSGYALYEDELRRRSRNRLSLYRGLSA